MNPDDDQQNQGGGQVTPVADPESTAAPTAAPGTDTASTEEVAEPTPAAHCVKCQGALQNGICSACTMPEAECSCPPTPPADSAA